MKDLPVLNDDIPAPRREGCACPSLDSHGCPFKEEIYEDYETECNCCENCRYECLMDI